MDQNLVATVVTLGVFLAGFNFALMALNNTHTPPALSLLTGLQAEPVQIEDTLSRSAYLFYGVSCLYTAYQAV